MLLDLSVVHPHRVYGLELYLFARGRNAKEYSLVRSVIGLEGRHDHAKGLLTAALVAIFVRLQWVVHARLHPEHAAAL